MAQEGATCLLAGPKQSKLRRRMLFAFFACAPCSLHLTPRALGVFWNIVLLDRETKEGNHRAIQKSIERVVEKESYEWQTLRVQEDGKIKVE